jgi:hypothetical protein
VGGVGPFRFSGVYLQPNYSVAGGERWSHKVALWVTLLVLVASLVYADVDPCPGKQRDFRSAVQTTQVAWAKANASLDQVTFDRVAVSRKLRGMLEQQAVSDIQGTITALNPTRPPDKQISISKETLALVAQKKVTAMLATPAMKSYVDRLLRDAETAFLEEKAKRRLELVQQKKQLDSAIDGEQKKLDDNCKYDVVSQVARIAGQLLQIDMRVQDGALKIGDFQTQLPVLNAGKVMLGNHHLMDVPVIKDGNLAIGGTTIAPLPVILSGGLNVPATVIAKALHIETPKIDVPVSIGRGGNDHRGLDMQIGPLKF